MSPSIQRLTAIVGACLANAMVARGQLSTTLLNADFESEVAYNLSAAGGLNADSSVGGGWFESSTSGFVDFIANSSAPGFSTVLQPNGNVLFMASSSDYIYQSLGTIGSETAATFAFDALERKLNNNEYTVTIELFASSTFVGANGTDVKGAVGVTALGSGSYRYNSGDGTVATNDDLLGVQIAYLDLTAASPGDEIWVRISTPRPSGDATLQIDNLSVSYSPTPLRITEFVPDFDANEVLLTWDSEVGKDYDIEVSSNLEDWDSIFLQTTATGLSTSVTIPDPAITGDSRRFYRVATSLLQNHDFEFPITADGELNNSLAPTAWTFIGSGFPGTFNPDSIQAHYTGMGNGDANGGVLPNMVGPTFGFMFPGDGNTGEFSQTVDAVLEENTSYTLTVAIGQRNYFNSAQVPSDFRIALETATSGTVVAEFTGDVLNQNPLTPAENSTGTLILTESTFTDFAATGTTGASPAGLGEDLVIVIQALADGRYLDADNVRLEIAPAP